MAPWRRAFDSRHRRPAICTSAAPAPRSSTGSTRAGTAARSCCASKTPTSSGRRPTWSPAFSTACAGWASTGTKGRTSVDRMRRTSSQQRLDRYRDAAARLVAQGHAYYCYCSPERLRDEREQAEQRGEAWQYDRACLALPPERIAELEAAGAPRAIRFKVPTRRTALRRRGARADRVRRRQHRGLRRPALRPASRPITSPSSWTTWTWGSRT